MQTSVLFWYQLCLALILCKFLGGDFILRLIVGRHSIGRKQQRNCLGNICILKYFSSDIYLPENYLTIFAIAKLNHRKNQLTQLIGNFESRAYSWSLCSSMLVGLIHAYSLHFYTIKTTLWHSFRLRVETWCKASLNN